MCETLYVPFPIFVSFIPSFFYIVQITTNMSRALPLTSLVCWGTDAMSSSGDTTINDLKIPHLDWAKQKDEEKQL